MIVGIFDQAVIILPLMMGAYITLSLMKVPDLSIESAFLFGAALAVIGEGTATAIGCALLGGCLVGASTATLNQVGHLPFLLAAIIVNGIVHGLTQFVLGTAVRTVSLEVSLPTTLLILTATSAMLALGLRTQMGYAYAIFGNNPQFFRSHQLSQRTVVISGVGIAGALPGLSGFLVAQRTGFIDLTMGYGTILLCLTGLILGRLLVRPKRPNILVPIVGVVVYFAMQQGLLVVGLNLKYFNAFQGLFVLAALVILNKKQHRLIDHLGV